MKKIILKSTAVLALTIIFITGSAQKAYMKAEGSITGIIKDMGVGKFSDKMELTGYSFEGIQPRDQATGAASGKSPKMSLSVTKNFGQSSVQFLNATFKNEVLKTVVIEVYKTNNQGQEFLEETITLSDVNVSSFKQTFDETPPPGTFKGPSDQITFFFRKINITNATSKASAEDSWH